MTSGLEIERRWLVRAPRLEALRDAGAVPYRIQQDYLSNDGARERVRCQTDQAGNVVLTHTLKRGDTPGVRHEDEQVIDAARYAELLARREPGRFPVRKTRWVFDHDGRRYELDGIREPVQLWIVELELDSVEELERDVTLPAWLDVTAEVTDLEGYSNASLSRGVLPELPQA